MTSTEVPAPRKLRISHCVPVYRLIPSEFLINFMSSLQYNMKQFEMNVLIQQDMPVDKARNSAIKGALVRNPDYIFFQDSDNLCPPNTIEKLLKTMIEKGADLVTGIYFEKQKPYYPVLRKYHSGGYWKMDSPPLGTVIKIDGCGMGVCLIKADVFRKLPEPWYKFNHEMWGQKPIQLSEDLYFTRAMMQKGMKMYCDTGVVSAHMGSSVDAFEFMTFKEVRESTMKDREELEKDLIKFTGLDRTTINQNSMVGREMLRAEWNKLKPKTDAEVRDFYATTDNYLYDLFAWHFSGRRQFDIELVTMMKKLRNDIGAVTVLDFGCGIAQNGYMIAKEGFDVTIADINSVTFNFARSRFIENDVQYREWLVDIKDEAPLKKYDVILAFDVLEHLTDDDFKDKINKLIKLKHKNTKVFITTSFGRSDEVPMHFENNPEKTKLIEKLLSEDTQ